MHKISVKRILDSEFDDMRESWNEVLENSSVNEVFLSWEWIGTWWSVFRSPDRELYLLKGVNDQGELVGLAPLYRESANLLGIRYAKVLKMCGESETYSDHLDMFCRKNWEESFVEAIFQYLMENYHEWDYMDLHGLGDTSAVKKRLTQRDPSKGALLCEFRDEADCLFIETSGGFEEYLKSFPSKKRYTLLRKRKLLGKGASLRIEELENPREVEKYYNTLVSLHAERFQRKRTRSTFEGEKMGCFHIKLIPELLKKKKIVLTILYRNDVALAANYCFRHNRKYYYYQSGLSKEGEMSSAGHVLLSRIIEKCFDEGCREFDFLRGAEEYKKYWANDLRKNISLRIRKENGKMKLFLEMYSWQQKMVLVSDKMKKMLINRIDKGR